MFRNRPERYADHGRIRTYLLIPDQNFKGGPEFDTRLMSSLHYSRQPSHIKFVTTPRGYVEQQLTTDMSLPSLGNDVMVEDITPEMEEE